MSEFQAPESIPNVPECLRKAALIYECSHTSATSLLTAFDDARQDRGRERGKRRGKLPRGSLTDHEQDILRAALVMACAGMDGALKQAIRDSLPHLIDHKDSVKTEFRKFIGRRIGQNEGTKVKFLAEILSEANPRYSLVEEYIADLTGDSLQSEGQVRKTLIALGIDSNKLQLDFPRLKQIFGVRNQIIHELDIDLDAPRRNRQVRRQDDLVNSADFVLDVTRVILEELVNAVSEV